MKHRIFTTIILTAVLLAGCGAEEKSEPEPAEEFEPVITITKEPTPEPTFAPIEPVKITPTAAATPAATPTPTPTATPTPTPEPIQASIAEEEPVVEPALTATPEATPEVIPEVTSEPAPEPTEEPEQSPAGTYLGTFTISFYCPCEICTGKWSGGATASGVMPTPWYTCAAADLPFGTVIQIDGLGTFEVQDRGVGSGWIDVFVSDHQEALNLGLQSRDVYIVG